MEYKLGKALPRIDSRTFTAKALFKAGMLPPAPESFDVDTGLNTTIVNPMFANDTHGDCVIAARAHMTRRFECFEQRQILPISDHDVINEYWKLQGYNPSGCLLKRFFSQRTAPDNGLVVLDALNHWRKDGWKAAGQCYDIHAYAKLQWLNWQEVKAGIFYLRGAYVGINLPASARVQLGGLWDRVDTPQGEPGGWGRHCVYVKAYDKDGLTCITWGAEQRMTWAFWNRYVDEAYLIVDNRNRFLLSSPVDVEGLEKILQEVAG